MRDPPTEVQGISLERVLELELVRDCAAVLSGKGLTSEEKLCDLDCIQRGALTQVVADHPEREPVLWLGRILADSAHEHFVPAGCGTGRRKIFQRDVRCAGE